MTLDFNPSTLTGDERMAEKNRIFTILKDAHISSEDMTEREAEFMESMQDATFCSPAQLNWLRRIKDKYL